MRRAVSQKTYHETDGYVPSRIGAIVADDLDVIDWMPTLSSD